MSAPKFVHAYISLSLLCILLLSFVCDVSAIKCKCDICANHTCQVDGGKCFTTVTKKKTGQDDVFEYKYGYRCFDDSHLYPKVQPMQCLTSRATEHYYSIQCCDSHDFCNMDLQPSIVSRSEARAEPTSVSGDQTGGGAPRRYLTTLEMTLVVAAPICLLCVGVTAFLLFAHWHKMRTTYYHVPAVPYADYCESGLGPGDGSLNAIIGDWVNSGSGSGLPLLVQRTIARTIQLQECIGKGRFGSVWRGRWRGENVAVKIFSSREERSWFREAELYQTVMLRHENILGFIAADNKDIGLWTELWLVTEFVANGSLFDYLSRCSVDVPSLCHMASGIAGGLAHLHMEIQGLQGKPAIAHRDLKSKNILVKENLTCLIADLGLAVRYDANADAIDIAPNNRVGTRRYMAPEVLDDTLNVAQFESFKRADVYAFGLVLWEMARRTKFAGHLIDDFQLPYFHEAPADPTVEDMRLLVCDRGIRPAIPNRWSTHPVLSQMTSLMKECWRPNPAARLSALRVKKNLAVIADLSRETIKKVQAQQSLRGLEQAV